MEDLPSAHKWLKNQSFKSTANIKIPKRLVDQVIGQDEAVDVIKKAATQRRHFMLIGDPGTGKSMLARSMADLLSKEELEDVIAYHNPEDPNNPKIRVVPATKGREIVKSQKANALMRKEQKSRFKTMIVIMIVVISVMAFITITDGDGNLNPMILLFGFIAAAIVWMAMRGVGPKADNEIVPKLLLGHSDGDMPPFIDATGAHAGALLGDVKHDPFQSGGLETPAHDRVEIGAIHKAHKGVLFIDEINTLRMESQQNLLTALQEKEFPIMGQSERSSGAMVKSDPVPTDFVLVAAGNLDSLNGMHPALRSRIRGYGYEIYVKNLFDDSAENRRKLVRFVAQEVSKDRKIPHFDRGAMGEIILEAQRRAGRKGQLSLRFRELGGMVRAAGDIGHEVNAKIVQREHVIKGRHIARSLEQQVSDRQIEAIKDRRDSFMMTTGSEVGSVNGLAVLNSHSSMNEQSGMVLKIIAEVTPPQSKNEGAIIVTGIFREVEHTSHQESYIKDSIAKESVKNVSALIKRHTGQDISNLDIHVQFVGDHNVEGDSASISVATAVISALENIPVDQTLAMTGSLSIRGKVLPVGGITAKIEAAAELGIKTIIIPKANLEDVLIQKKYKKKIKIIPVENLREVLDNALIGNQKQNIMDKLTRLLSNPDTPLDMEKRRKTPTHSALDIPLAKENPTP